MAGEVGPSAHPVNPPAAAAERHADEVRAAGAAIAPPLYRSTYFATFPPPGFVAGALFKPATTCTTIGLRAKSTPAAADT